MCEPKPEKNIKIGTSGFSYEDWVGPVYPKSVKKEEMLTHYSHELGFNIVELNYTYYTMPSLKSIEGMLQKVPEDFEFVVKAHSSMTHDIRDASGAYIRDEGSIAAYLSALAPMIEQGAVKCILAQFPLKFIREGGAIEHLKWLAESLSPLRLAVEFRNRVWLAQTVFDKLKKMNISFCVVDEPNLPKLMPFTPVATAPLAYFRFHGRNRNWFNVPTHVRYDYLYSDDELRQFIDPIGKISTEAEETVIFFNNHFQGSSVSNASRLKQLLEMP